MLITSIPNSYDCIPTNKIALKPVTKLKLKGQPTYDQFNFSGKKGYKFDLKNMPNLPCAYCAKTMITTNEQIRFGEKIKTLTGPKLRNALEFIANEDQFPIEQRAAKLLIRQSKQKPDNDAQELLMSAFPWAEKKLVKQQQIILNKLPELIENLTGKTKNTILYKFNEINLILNHCAPDYIFKKKAAVRGFHKVFEEEQDPKNQLLLEKSLKILATLPTSRNNLEAFVVKYSRRGPKEIGERLLDPFLSSTEHIEPDSENGVSKPYNYLVAHKDCNEKRGSEPFHLFIANNPQAIPNIENQIKLIAKKIENFETFGLENYPNQVARTLKTLSKNQINIDMAGFNPPDKTLRTFFELGNKQPQKPAPVATKVWHHPNANSGGSANQQTKPKMTKQAKRIAELMALMSSLTPKQEQIVQPINYKRKLRPTNEDIKIVPEKPRYIPKNKPKSIKVVAKPDDTISAQELEEKLDEALKSGKSGNLRLLKKQLKKIQHNVIVKKEDPIVIKGKMTTKPSSANKNSRKNRLAQKNKH